MPCENCADEVADLESDLASANRTIEDLRADLAAAVHGENAFRQAIDRISDQARDALRN